LVYCGNTADWIRMPFGVVSGVGQGMGVLDRGGDHRREGQFWGECGASHCNHWGLWRSHSLPLGVATRLLANYFGISCFMSILKVSMGMTATFSQ